MKILRFLVVALVATTFAAGAFALSPELTEWGNGPVQHIMTKDELAKWKGLRSDTDAKAFVDLFWARRDPTPETPRNEYRDEFDRRVATADKSFAEGKKRGAMTERGKTLILFGAPLKRQTSGNDRNSSMPTGISNDPSAGVTEEDVKAEVWIYEGAQARDSFNIGRAQVRFVDRFGRGDFQLERSGVDYASAQRRVAEAAIKNPTLTVAPTFAAAPAGGAPVAAAGAPPVPETPIVQTELTTESLKAAVAEFKSAGKPATGKTAHAFWGEYVTAEGDYFVPVQIYLPKSAGVNASNLTFFGVVQDESGKNLVAFEEPATLVASKDDFFVDRSLTGLPAGKTRGYFGLAENGTPVSLVAVDMNLAGSIDKTATASSQLILSNNVFPLQTAQKPNDPYSFGGLKVVPKADRTFRKADELWWFLEMRNPGVPEAAADATAPAVPKVQVKIDVEGTDTTGKKIKFNSPPREVEAIEIKGVPGHYGVGNAVPLASFKPGDYTFSVKVIDTIKKSSYTLSEKFTVIE
ncbi:MAG TPA: GWxTD domain-containing protein [Thermoanaerobaculia bacterium]|nr:GWxTD domain-containing protein [Thermoanaerobaculia bacterium]